MGETSSPRVVLSPAPWHAALAIPVLYLFGYLVDRAYYGRIQMENPGLQPGQHMVVGVQFVAFTAFPALIVLLALWGYAKALGGPGHSNADHGLRRIWRRMDARRAARRTRPPARVSALPRRTSVLAARVRLGRVLRSGRFRTGVHGAVLLFGRVGMAGCLAALGIVFWMVILDFTGVGQESRVGRGYGAIIAFLTLLVVYLRSTPPVPAAGLVLAPMRPAPAPTVPPYAHVLWLGPLLIVLLPVLTAIYGGSLYPSIEPAFGGAAGHVATLVPRAAGPGAGRDTLHVVVLHQTANTLTYVRCEPAAGGAGGAPRFINTSADAWDVEHGATVVSVIAHVDSITSHGCR